MSHKLSKKIFFNLSGHFNVKVDFRARYITKEKESYFLMIKGSIHHEDISLTFMYLVTELPNRKLIEEGDISTIIIKGLNIPLSKSNGTNTQKMSSDRKAEHRKI